MKATSATTAIAVSDANRKTFNLNLRDEFLRTSMVNEAKNFLKKVKTSERVV